MIRAFTLSSRYWEDIFVSRPTPSGDDPWGTLRPLVGTEWEALIPVVPVNVFDDAVHGHPAPLLNIIGRPPERLLKMAPVGLCVKQNRCALLERQNCKPGPKMPTCYVPPIEDDRVQEAVRLVLQAWRKGYYVIVVEE